MSSISTSATSHPRLVGFLGIEKRESTALGLMVALYFILTAAFVFVQTTAFGLFIDEFGSQNLPFAYISVAVLTSLIAFAYLRLSQRVSFGTAKLINLGFLTLMCLVFWAGLRSPLGHWFIFLLPFWFQTLVGLANLVVWPLSGHIFDLRQAKRLYGPISAGNWLANILGGFVIAPILALTGAANLYLLAAVAVAMAVPVLWVILNGPHMHSAAAPLPEKAPSPSRPGPSPLKHPYSRLIFAYTLLWWMAFVFVDNIFLDRAGIQFPTASALAGFIGQQLSVIGIIAIITATFLTSRIISRIGLLAGLIAMPAVVALSVAAIAIGGTLGASNVVLFWTAVVAKTFNLALGFSISLAAGSLLYLPLLGHQRESTHTISEGIVQPVAIGAAGVILLLFNTTLHFNAVGLSYIFLAIAAPWLWVTYRLSRKYPEILSEALRKRSLGENTALMFDCASLGLLQDSLKSPRAGVVLYALNQLEQLGPRVQRKALVQGLPSLLAHPAQEVRSEAMKRVLSLRLQGAAPLLRRRLIEETTPAVYAVLIQALAALGDAESHEQIMNATEAPDRMIRFGAIVGLLMSADGEQIAHATEIITRWVASRDADDRALAAEVFAATDQVRSQALLDRLLADEAVTVRRAAVRAAGRQAGTQMLERVVAAVDMPETAQVAEQVLVQSAEAGLPAIADGLGSTDQTAVPRQRLHSLARVLGAIQHPKSIDLLRARLDHPDPQLRLQVLRSLSKLGFRAKSIGEVVTQIKSEIGFAALIVCGVQALQTLERPEEAKVLQDALEAALQESRSRVLLLLSLVYDPQAILRAHKTLEERAVTQAAFALETVDSLLPVGLKPLILPLIENNPPERRLRDWRAAGVQTPALTIDGLIDMLLGDQSEVKYSPWIRMCAIYVAGTLRLEFSLEHLQRLRTASDPRICDMSQWSLQRLSPATHAPGERDMLSLVEKVLILKSASLFSETPDNVLADVAEQVAELSFDQGESIFNKGDHGDSMYIVVSGRVQVWDGNRLLNELGEGDLFGELALLDPEPRVASVKAVESTRVLRLDESHFRQILAERPEVPAAIIRVITRYLRSQLQRNASWSAQMKASDTLSGGPISPQPSDSNSAAMPGLHKRA